MVINSIGIIMMTMLLGFLVGTLGENYGIHRIILMFIGLGIGILLPKILIKLLYKEDKVKQENEQSERTSKN